MGRPRLKSSPYIFDASADNFARLVCLCGEFAGRFLLVMLNTDELGQLARKHGVTSIPAIKVFRHGRVVDTLHGAESETSLRAFIGRHVQVTSDTLRDVRTDPAARRLAAHVALIRAAHTDETDDMLRARIAGNADDHDARLALAGRHAINDDYEAAMLVLVELAQMAPLYRDGIARDALLALLELLGDEDARVEQFRASLAS